MASLVRLLLISIRIIDEERREGKSDRRMAGDKFAPVINF